MRDTESDREMSKNNRRNKNISCSYLFFLFVHN